MHILHTGQKRDVWLSLHDVLRALLQTGFHPAPRVSVLVGAPKANTSQPGIVEAGAVYYCPWPGLPDSCRQIPFDNSSEYHRLTKDDYMVEN